MFDFEKLEVYDHLRNLNKKVFKKILIPGLDDSYLQDQLKRAQLNALLNLSEGTGRMSKADKKRFYIIARSSLYEVVSIMHVLKDLDKITDDVYDDIYADCERGSKMLLGMIRSMSEKVAH